jgi:hypothetical protein
MERRLLDVTDGESKRDFLKNESYKNKGAIGKDGSN